MKREDVIQQYGSDLVTKFCSYYKDEFTYRADLPDGKFLHCVVIGGEDTYRLELESEMTFAELDPNYFWISD